MLIYGHERLNHSGLSLQPVNKVLCSSVAVFIAMVLFAFPSQSQVYVGGSLLADATYSPGNNPYIVTQDLIVTKGITLTILPGVEMLFEIGTSIISDGTLVAKGLPDQKIRFLPKNQLSFPGQWNGIVFNNAKTILEADSSYGSGSVLSEANITYASYSVTLAKNSSLLIENTKIEFSSFGIYIMESGYNTIRNCSINGSNFGIFIASGFNNPGNIISGNAISGSSDVGIFINSSSVQSHHNIIKENHISSCIIGLHVGNYINNGTSFNTIKGNTFYENKDAIKLFQHSNTIQNNFFVRNRNGIICWQSNHNTITENLFSRNTLSALTLTAGSSFNTVTNNSLNYNKGGVWIKPDSMHNSLYNSFLYNTLYGNSEFSFQILNAPQGPVQFNNIGRNGSYHSFINLTDSIVHAEYNFWGTTSESSIDSIISDLHDQPQIGEVIYKPILDQILTTAPVPPPDHAIKQIIGNDLVVSWDTLVITDFSGYNVHYGSKKEVAFEHTINNGTYTMINMGSIPVDDTIAVTAYDSQVDNLNDQTEGHESDFTISILAPYAGPDTAICFNSGYSIYLATAFNTDSLAWSTSGDGMFTSTNVLNPVYTPGEQDYLKGYVYLYLDDETAKSEYTDVALITFHDAPLVFAGNDSTIFTDSALMLNTAAASRYDFLKWTSSGDGYFDTDTLINPIYMPGPGDILAGSVVLKIEGFSACGSASDQLLLTINPGFSLKGRIHAGESLAAKANIYLYLDKEGDIQPFRSGLMTMDGNFEINALHAGNYYLYAIPDKSENPDYLPTYYFNDIHWENAYRLDLYANTYDLDIRLAKSPLQLPLGEGSIKGYVTTLPGSTEKCGDVTVLLYDKQMKNVIDWALVRNGNDFSFINLPFGDYVLAGEKTGNQSFYSEVIVLSPLHPQPNDIQLLCTAAGYKFSNPGNVRPQTLTENITIYPNPVLDWLHIKGLKESEKYTIRLINSQGYIQKFYTVQDGIDTNSLFLGKLSTGFYIIEVYRLGDCLLREKLVKY